MTGFFQSGVGSVVLRPRRHAQPLRQGARIVRVAGRDPRAVEAWARAARGAPAFLGPDFLRLTARHAHLGDPLVVLADERFPARAAALALARDGHDLRSLQSDQTPRFDMVGDTAALPSLWSALRDDRSWDRLELEDVPDISPVAVVLPALARADGFLVATRPGLRSPWFPLDGFESRLSSKFCANLRRCKKNLADLTYERITRYDRAALDEGLAMERATWKGASGTAIACDGERRRFYEAVVRVLARRGQVDLEFLRARGRRIAFGIGIEDGTTHYELKIAFDPEFRAHSPGHLLVERAAADARARGLSRFDFLGWDHEWKRKWTDRLLSHVTVAVYRPSVRGRLLHAAREIALPRLVDLKHAAELLSLGPGAGEP
jgi:CelD/BcsL family acetyltransferase involved in cellulose biosynthesis